MPVLNLILYLAVAGFVVYLITLVPMPEVFRKVIIAIAIFGLVVFILQGFGLVHTPFRLR